MQEVTINIKSLSREELTRELAGLGMKHYRARQIHEWLYRKGSASFEEMTNLSKAERALLGGRFSIFQPEILRKEVSSDGTRKFLFGLSDGHTVESVLIPDEDRNTLCISSQVGCAQGCRFCLTGSGGLQRNLEAFEIVDQVSAVKSLLEQERAAITNIVLMGMGEPLANFERVSAALRVITAEEGLGFSPRRLTLSTDGLVPGIDALGRSGLNVNLAVSLNATTDEVRSRIMPVNRRFPIKELLAACRRYPLPERRRITFEYVLLSSVNDSTADALRLADLLKGIRSKINLIPFNPFPGSEFRRPADHAVRRFQQLLLDRHYTAPVRESRGRDISAACGQLREKTASAEGNRQ